MHLVTFFFSICFSFCFTGSTVFKAAIVVDPYCLFIQ